MRKAPLFLAVLALLVPMPTAAAGESTGRIVGTARRAADGTPIPSASVHFENLDGKHVGQAQALDGKFASPGLEPGSYRAYIRSTKTEVGQAYGGKPCPSPYHPCGAGGAEISVKAGQDTEIAFSLLTGAFVTGQVFGPDGTLADYLSVQVIDSENRNLLGQRLDVGRPYRLGPLPPGRYNILAWANLLPRQLYPDRICIDSCDFSDDGAIALGLGEVRDKIDVHLSRFGELKGQVVDRKTGTPISSAEIRFFEAATRKLVNPGRNRHTRPDGRFAVDNLPPGKYLVTAVAARREGRVLGDVPFLHGGEEAALPAGEVVEVPAGAARELPPLRLRQLGAIRGQIYDGSGSYLSRAEVYAYSGGRRVRQDITSAHGAFELTGLEPGPYQVVFLGHQGRQHLIGSNDVCVTENALRAPLGEACEFEKGTTFEVGFDETVDVGTFSVPAGGRIRGTIRLAPEEVGMPSLEVFAHGSRRVLSRQARVPGNEWQFDIYVPPGGPYSLVASSPGHRAQLYDRIDCAGEPKDCAAGARALTLDLVSGDDHIGIDFDLKLAGPAPRE